MHSESTSAPAARTPTLRPEQAGRAGVRAALGILPSFTADVHCASVRKHAREV